MNNEPTADQPVKPLAWTWNVQRSVNDKDDKVIAKWQFGFIAPDGADVRVTLHKTNDGSDGNDATYYVTFFCNHSPESFTKWDTSLGHEDSLAVWVTVTHGLIDFIKKSDAKNVVFDDLANGKLKMILRSLCMDLVDDNPGYEFERTKKGQFRSFYQVKKQGTPSAFDSEVRGTDQEGETATPATPDETTGPDESRQPEPENDAAESAQEPTAGAGNVVEIGRDNSVTVRDPAGHALDRYHASSPRDIIRWLKKKGYEGYKMKIVAKAQPALNQPEENGQEEDVAESVAVDSECLTLTEQSVEESECVVVENAVVVRREITPACAAQINEVVGATVVRKLDEGVSFEWETPNAMEFKRAMVERLLSESTTDSPR
jgi:hypothetical protein